MMVLLTIGVNYQTAPKLLREKMVIHNAQSQNLIQKLLQTELAKEVLILSTCNRTELYCYTEQEKMPLILQCLGQVLKITSNEILPFSYSYIEEFAVRHLMAVASGLNSMVLGEVEILGQIKTAFRQADKMGSIGKYLGRLFQTTFAVAKRVRYQTGIGLNPMSVAGIAVKLAERIFTDIKQATVLLVGAGDLIRLTGMYLKKAGVKKVIIANRSQTRGENLAKILTAEAIRLEEIPLRLAECDIVIAGTGSTLPLIGKGMVERALKQRKSRSIFMIDLALPRDIEAEVASLEAVYLYCLDDLQQMVQENRCKREKEIVTAEQIIREEAQYFMQWCQAQNSLITLKAFRKKFTLARDEILSQSLQHLKLGKSPEIVLQQALHKMSNRLLHKPTQKLRQAVYKGDVACLSFARELFDLELELENLELLKSVELVESIARVDSVEFVESVELGESAEQVESLELVE